jgi:Rieske Fe-S protein
MTQPLPESIERRSWLRWAIHGLGALFAAILGNPALAYLIDARNRPAPSGDFKTVARLSELQVGVPHQAVIRDVRRDAWTLHPNDVVGRVWLIRRDKNQVDAFTTICPHLGCSVNFEEKNNLFVCPCHNGTFRITGERVSEQELHRSNPAPRGMDSLETQLVKDPSSADDPVIQVKYQNFIQGRDEKVPKA